MKKWLLYELIFAAAVVLNLSPFQGTDVGKLLPVELVRVSADGRNIILETDTGDMGKGGTVEEALSDLKATTAGTVFLETADYLLIQPGCEELLDDLVKILRPSCSVCVELGDGELKKAAKYFAAHEPQVTLQDWRCGFLQLPRLVVREGRMEIVS